MRALPILFLMLATMPAAAETVKLHAAGSLRAALTDVARAFEADSNGAHRVEASFGPSGTLREKIEAGEPAHVFASADMGHPSRLASAGKTTGAAVVFARNGLCALVRGGLAADKATILDVMLAPDVKLGISTPRADPSGDYAVAAFAKAESLRSGAQMQLLSKTLQLTGGPTSAKPPEGRLSYTWLIETGAADVFLTYCTNALLALKELPSARMVALPAAMAVGADYGLVVLQDAPLAASNFAAFLRSDKARKIMTGYGFGVGD